VCKSINELNSDLFSAEADDRFASPLEARKKAMDFLARREHGYSELVEKLVGRGFEAEAATAAVDRLADQGLQSDQRFVENFIQSRIKQGKGPLRVQQELGNRGLAAGLVEQSLEVLDTDWCASACEVRHRKFGVALPGDFKEKARQMRFLQYRGFESEHISAAMNDERDE
jgi:regulatory protein